MTKGKNTRRKDRDLRNRQEVKRKEREEDDVQVQEVSATYNEPPETLTTLLKIDEVTELRKILNIKDLVDVPLLVGAAAIGKFELIKRLLKDGQHIDCFGPGQITPLMLAVKRVSIEMIDLLVTRGADVTLVDVRGDNAIMLALQDPKWDQETFLDLWNLVKDNEKLDINHSNIVGHTIFHYAIHKQWEILIESLLEKKVDLNCATTRGVTPLMLAGTGNHLSIVKILLRAGADIAREDKRGCTVLCYAFASMVQKRRSNPTLERLVAALNSEDEAKNLKVEDYIQRRLELLITPPEDEIKFVETITSIIKNIMNFFVHYFLTGAELILELQAFAKIAHAIDRHLNDEDYCHALVGILFELVRYCPCCYGGGRSNITEEILTDAFVDAGAADACLDILKTHCSAGEAQLLLVAALMPLFCVCGGVVGDTHKRISYIWLEKHYLQVKPFFTHYNQMRVISFNFNADQFHIRQVKERIKTFSNNMHLFEENIQDSPKENEICKNRTEDTHPMATTDAYMDFLNSKQQFLSCNSKKARRKAAKAVKVKLETLRNLNLVEAKNTAPKNVLVENSSNVKVKTDRVEHLAKKSSSNMKVETDCVEYLAMKSSEEYITKRTLKNVDLIEETSELPQDSLLYFVDEDADGATSETKPRDALDKAEGVTDTDITTIYNSVPDNKLVNTNCPTNSSVNEETKERTHLTPCISEIQLKDGNSRGNTDIVLTNYYAKPDSFKDLTGAAYIENVFREILCKFLDLWEQEKENKFPGHCVKKLPSGEDITLVHLNRILPPMEKEYLRRLNKRWQSLIGKLRLSDKDTFHIFVGRLDVLLQWYLIDIGSIEEENDSDNDNTSLDNDRSVDNSTVVDLTMRKRRLELSESVLPTEDLVLKKARMTKENGVIVVVDNDLSSSIATSEDVDESTDGRYSSCCQSSTKSTEGSISEGYVYTDDSSIHSNFTPLKRKTKCKTQKKNVKYRNLLPIQVGLIKCNTHKEKSQTALRNSNVNEKPSFRPQFKYRSLKKRPVQRKKYNFKTIPTSSIFNMQEPCYAAPSPPGFPPHPINSAENLAQVKKLLSPDYSRFVPTQPDSKIEDFVTTQEEIVLPLVANCDIFRHAKDGYFGDKLPHLESNDTGAPLAVKYIHFDEPNMREFLQEVMRSLLKLRHKNIAHYVRCHLGNNVLLLSNTLCKYNLMEYMAVLVQENRVGDRSKSLIINIMSGINYLHTLSSPIMHGNLKPSNVLVDNRGVAILADFGLNNIQYSNEEPSTSSRIWWSSETHLNYQRHSAVFCTLKSDIQVAGMLLHYVDTGGDHPYGNSDEEIIKNIAYHEPTSKTTNYELENLMMLMICHESSRRPLIKEAFTHLYFWDVSRKWSLVLACAGIIYTRRDLDLQLPIMNDLHLYIDTRKIFQAGSSWIPHVTEKFSIMEPIEGYYINSTSGLLRFIRACVERDYTPSPFNFPLIDFFLNTFPVLPLTLYQLIVDTPWMNHQALQLSGISFT